MEETWRDGFVAAMQRKQASNEQINSELEAAADKADAEGKTPKGALGDPGEYAASLDYPDKRFKYGEALAGAAVLVGAFVLSDGLLALRDGLPYELTLGSLISWLLVFGGVLVCLYLATKFSGAAVLAVALPLLLVWAFVTQAPTAVLWQGDPVVAIVAGAIVLVLAFAYVASYLQRQNANPVRDPDSGDDIRFGDQKPSFVQLWGPLVYMAVAVLLVVVLLIV
ncbi:hypothetical protein EK0264_12260 [Epidermidibacterium keratini]|uniref:Uncharacterized protein n=1 Tax=Epidermidibacterium keratini TaxID=1891644 RepID=A0A7L4YPZ9_9ACTN|nr:hypothetical protein [Epidermidibacterium keratini]QHC00983.1 hypothetical protein EK0264_12260 [Epidermidibacterium keratini]